MRLISRRGGHGPPKSRAESSAPHVGTKNGNGAQDLSPQRWPAKGKRSPIRNPVLSANNR